MEHFCWQKTAFSHLIIIGHCSSVVSQAACCCKGLGFKSWQGRELLTPNKKELSIHMNQFSFIIHLMSIGSPWQVPPRFRLINLYYSWKSSFLFVNKEHLLDFGITFIFHSLCFNALQIIKVSQSIFHICRIRAKTFFKLNMKNVGLCLCITQSFLEILRFILYRYVKIHGPVISYKSNFL